MINIEKMKFYPHDIGRIAESFLTSLDKEKVKSLDDLKGKVGTVIRIDSINEITFDEKRHSPPKGIGISYIASYKRKESGITIEFRVNDICGFALITVKAQEILPGYKQLLPAYVGPDIFGNIAQDKVNRLAGFDWVIRELRYLS